MWLRKRIREKRRPCTARRSIRGWRGSNAGMTRITCSARCAASRRLSGLLEKTLLFISCFRSYWRPSHRSLHRRHAILIACYHWLSPRHFRRRRHKGSDLRHHYRMVLYVRASEDARAQNDLSGAIREATTSKPRKYLTAVISSSSGRSPGGRAVLRRRHVAARVPVRIEKQQRQEEVPGHVR